MYLTRKNVSRTIPIAVLMMLACSMTVSASEMGTEYEIGRAHV